jgi:tRNA (guanosine-2'-O-)-methyltransferase
MDGFGVQNLFNIQNFSNKRANFGGVSKGAEKWLNLFNYTSPEQCVEDVKKEGHLIWVSDLDEGKPLDEIKFSPDKRHAFVFGNEHSGCSEYMKKICDGKFVIPMNGFAQSLNISVSVASTLMYLRTVGLLTPDLTPQQQEQLYFKWLCVDVKDSNLILSQLDKTNPSK